MSFSPCILQAPSYLQEVSWSQRLCFQSINSHNLSHDYSMNANLSCSPKFIESLNVIQSFENKNYKIECTISNLVSFFIKFSETVWLTIFSTNWNSQTSFHQWISMVKTTPSVYGSTNLLVYEKFCRIGRVTTLIPWCICHTVSLFEYFYKGNKKYH